MRFEIAVVSYNTDFLLLNLLESIRDRLPGTPAVHVWDNGSTDATGPLLARFQSEAPWLRVHRSAENRHHGPALDHLLRDFCESEWVLLLDSDAEIRADFRAALPEPGDAAVFIGQIHPQPNQLYAYLCHLLVHRPWYLRLPPFRHHGAPGIDLFAAVERHGLPYRRFRFGDHVAHLGQGTLRALVERGERDNDLFAFAAEEVSTHPPSAERLAAEERMRMRLAAYLGLPPAPPRTETPRPSRARRRRRPSALTWPDSLLLSEARRLGLTTPDSVVKPWMREIRALRPRRVLELGTGYGATLYLLTRLAAPDALLVSVDLPPWELDDPGESERLALFRSFARRGQRVELIRADPESALAKARIAELGPYDLTVGPASLRHDPLR